MPLGPDADVPSDGSVDPDGMPGDGSPDAPIDAPPDAPPVDLTPPSLVAIAPASGSATWLHDSIRLVFDEPVRATANVSVSLGATAIDASVSRLGDRTLVIDLEASARGIGNLDVRVTNVEDTAGNAIAAPITAQYTIEPWHRPAIDRGAATGAPAIAVAADGAVTAAWIVGGAGARRVVVSWLAAGAWQPMGGALGAADTTSVAVAVDASGTPTVGWIESGTTQLARWTGATWAALPSLGPASALALASPPGGGRIVALAIDGGDAKVFALVDDAWTALGSTISLGGALVGEPALATPADNVAVIGWITQAGGAHTLRTHRYNGNWSAMSTIALGASPAPLHLSLAARGTALALAWDQHAGSFGVFAARSTLSSNGWQRLDGAIDVDVAGDATHPAIGLDATGNAVVAWREKIETAERGVLARWNGSAWTVLGGHTWLPAANATPAATRIAMQGSAPVVGWTANGDLGVARLNGPRTAAVGMATRPPLAGCAFSAANPPARVLQTGCFTIAGAGKPRPHAGLVPYDIVVELWSDGAKKRRWIGLPAGQSMTSSPTGAWAAPAGTFIVKEFAIETTPGNAATRRAVETRFLVRTSSGWQGFTYRWRADGSDADLLTDGTFTQSWTLDNGSTYTHVYPSRSQCLSCHDSSYGPLLGIRPQQLQRWYDYDGVIADQIPTLANLDVGPASTAAPFAAPHDPSASVEQRVRGYMASNCAHCHNPNHIAIKDLRYPTALANTRLCSSIVPGSPEQSVLYQKVSSRPGMPPLATLVPDPLMNDLLYRWIDGMSSCP